jgi:hypothetical protein
MIKLLSLIIFVGYIFGIWKFWNGFNRTNFNRDLPNRLILSLMWPVLFVINKPYRQNFQKALKGK